MLRSIAFQRATFCRNGKYGIIFEVGGFFYKKNSTEYGAPVPLKREYDALRNEVKKIFFYHISKHLYLHEYWLVWDRKNLE